MKKFRLKNTDRVFKKIFFLTLCALFFTLCPLRFALCADAPASVKEGNNLYRQGKYDEALKYYNEAEAEESNSDVVSFNKGAAFYRKGDYQKAMEAFNKALLSDNPGIEEKAAYNIGNSKYRLGELKKNTDLASAVNFYRQALDYYKRAIELNQNNTDAKYNYEFVEKELKILLDKLKQKQEQEQQQAQAATSGQEEKKQGQEQQAVAQGEEEKEGGQEEEVQEQAKGYQLQEAQEEMSKEEAEMILNRYDQQDQFIGNIDKDVRGRRYPRTLKDW
jgi:Ca-activated chloride channel family protein